MYTINPALKIADFRRITFSRLLWFFFILLAQFIVNKTFIIKLKTSYTMRHSIVIGAFINLLVILPIHSLPQKIIRNNLDHLNTCERAIMG